MINESVAQEIAQLSKLQITTQEIEALNNDLLRLAAFVQSVGVLPEPPTPAAPSVNLLRTDTAAPCFPRDALLRNAKQQDGCFVVRQGREQL